MLIVKITSLQRAFSLNYKIMPKWMFIMDYSNFIYNLKTDLLLFPLQSSECVVLQTQSPASTGLHASQS